MRLVHTQAATTCKDCLRAAASLRVTVLTMNVNRREKWPKSVRERRSVGSPSGGMAGAVRRLHVPGGFSWDPPGLLAR